jgi:hypothetical protein
MKYIYVLICSEHNTYYEQFLLSVASLFFYNREIDVIVLTDKTTSNVLVKKNLNHGRSFKIKVVDTPSDLSQKKVSRFIKTSMRKYITGDFLFIDCDTIITEKLDYDFPSNIQIGAVLDTHVPLSKHHLFNDFQKRDKIAGFQISGKIDAHYNSGIIFCRDTPETHVFFDKWHNLWVKSNSHGISSDQSAFNQANYELNNVITELPGEWNCQISHNGLPYLHDAKIIHYYATSLVSFAPAYRLASGEVLTSIKTTGEISPEIMKMLENPKAAFEVHSRIIADPSVIGVFDGSLFSKLIWLNRRYPLFFKRCDSCMAGFTGLVKKILGKR